MQTINAKKSAFLWWDDEIPISAQSPNHHCLSQAITKCFETKMLHHHHKFCFETKMLHHHIILCVKWKQTSHDSHDNFQHELPIIIASILAITKHFEGTIHSFCLMHAWALMLFNCHILSCSNSFAKNTADSTKQSSFCQHVSHHVFSLDCELSHCLGCLFWNFKVAVKHAKMNKWVKKHMVNTKSQAAPISDRFIYDESIATLREMLANGGAIPTTMTQPSLPSIQTQTQNSDSGGYLIHETQDETKEEDSSY